MTFLHKLARRLAAIATTAILTTPFLASCTPGTTQEYLGPDPHKPNPSVTYIGLSITPNDPQLVQGDSIRLQARGWLPSGVSSVASVSWSATGGVVSSDGWYRATSPGSFRVRAVVTANPGLADSVTIAVIPQGGIARLDITPSGAPLAAGTQQQFTAVVLMGDGSRMYPTVSWSAIGGSITPGGLFTAPGTEGSYTVTASTIDGALLGRTTGVVGPPVLRGLALAPGAVIMESGATVQFNASALWSDGSSWAPPLTWAATGGTVASSGPSGVYTAGATAGSFRVIASGLGKADTANVTILPRTVALRLSPLTALLAVGATQAVTAFAIRSDGSESPVVAQWSAEGGTISPSGVYTAGTVPGTYAVVGTLSASGTVLRDTAHFQVQADEAASVPVFVRPDTTVLPGTKVQFVASSSGDGGSVAAVSWSATGGSINSEGLYTAGPTSGNFRVVGKRKNGNKADTATVIIEPAPVVTVSGFTISPQSAIIASGESRQFSATLSWSDGNIHPSEISWVSSGGTITQNGLYTAGTLAGAYLVIATCGCGAADTVSVTIPVASAPAATLSKVVLTPSIAELNQGESAVFTVTGVWSDGATSPPPVTFTATGGSITPAGAYVAGTSPGTFRVIATQTGGSLADTSVVVIRQGAATLTGLSINPSSASVPPGATQAFVVSASWSNGSTVVPPVTFSATGGIVSPAGVYTAGATPGSYQLIATHTGGTKADTSTIVIPSGVTLTQVTLNPSSVSIVPGWSQQMVAIGSWSDGSSLTPPVTYSATGGTISATGLYTAGPATGTFQIIAMQTGGGKADTSAVTISTTPPTGPLPVSLPAQVLRWMGPLTPASATPSQFARYETDFVKYEALRWAADGQGGSGGSGSANPPGGCKPYQQYDFTNYYQRDYLLYQFWARTGDATYRVHADSIMRCYRDGYMALNNYQGQPNEAQMEGIAVHYWLTGDPLSKNTIVGWTKKFYPGFSADKLAAQGESFLYWEGRIYARILIAVLLCIEMGDTSMPWAQYADDLVRETIRLQHADGSFYMRSYAESGQGSQANFSAAMLNYAWAKYYRLRTPNPAILTAIKKSLDYLWSTQWMGTGFKYSTNSTTPANDLTGMLVYGWGFYANATGDLSYQAIGDQIFAKMILGFYNGPKQFNQQYRETALYLGLRR